MTIQLHNQFAFLEVDTCGALITNLGSKFVHFPLKIRHDWKQPTKADPLQCAELRKQVLGMEFSLVKRSDTELTLALHLPAGALMEQASAPSMVVHFVLKDNILLISHILKDVEAALSCAM